MRPRIQSTLFPSIDRPVIIGEYPYYRAHPDRWASNLRELRDLGVDAVSCYLPWRFHEIVDNGQPRYDFTGDSDPQRDVNGLLSAIAETGLLAVVKPGPFIHAEVQLGGLPDRLCEPERYPPVVGTSGQQLLSQGKPLPSLYDPATRTQVEGWMRAVASEVIAPRLAPAGPIVAVQIGNEGLYGEVHLPITRQDASRPARAAFANWLAANGETGLVGYVTVDASEWPTELRGLWSRWSGQAIAEHWRWLADLLPAGTSTVVNVPLAPAGGTQPTVDAWAARGGALAESGHLLGHTEWVGNIAASIEAFQSHLLGIRLGQTDVLEANWGFTWTDSTFAEPHTPLFHALFSLMLGSSTCSVYTACATESWGELIKMDHDGLRADGVDPRLHVPPYCPGAPSTESGALSGNAEALRLLRDFLRQHGTTLLNSALVADVVLEIDRALPEAQAWSEDGRTVLQQVAADLSGLLLRDGVLIDPQWSDQKDQRSAPHRGTLRCSSTTDGVDNTELLVNLQQTRPEVVTAYLDGLAAQPHSMPGRWTNTSGRTAVLRRRTPEGRTELVGVFNPTAEDDTVLRTNAAGRWELHVPAGTAAVLVIRDGVLGGWVATPSTSPWPEVALTTPDDVVKSNEWFGAVSGPARQTSQAISPSRGS